MMLSFCKTAEEFKAYGSSGFSKHEDNPQINMSTPNISVDNRI